MKRYFFISYIGKNKYHEVTYGTTTITVDTGKYFNRQSYFDTMKEVDVVDLTILNIIEMSESDFADFNDIVIK